MPNIVKYYGVNLIDEVVKIKDVTLRRPPKKTKAAPKAADVPPGDGPAPEGEEAFEAFEPEQLASGEAAAAEFEEDEYEQDGAEYGGFGGVREEIIQSAMAEAGKILENAVWEAEEKRREILGGVEAEALQLRQQALEEGKQEGLHSATGEIKGVASQIEQMLAVFEGERAGFEFEYEEQLKWLAFEIASKVLAKKIADDDAVMLDMIDKAVQGVRNEPWVRVEISKEMTNLIDRMIALYDESGNVSVQPAPTEPGTVRVETPAGVVDASIKTQLENLRDYFIKAAGPGA